MRIAVTGGSGFIGTNFIEEALGRGHTVENYDVLPPRNQRQGGYWLKTDILDREDLAGKVRVFAPDVVVHLAAQTDLVETRGLAYYAANTHGVANVVDAVSRTPSVRRIVFASTMLVCRYGYTPSAPDEYCPNTLYGKSKVVGEEYVRTGRLPCSWTIIRPTSIWGPWCEKPYKQFLTSVCRGMYVHTGSQSVPKALGFVGNTVFQLFRILESPEMNVSGRTFYLLDYSETTIREWATRVQELAGARRIPTLPLWSLKCAAYAGDLLRYAGWKNPPMTTFRLTNMTTRSRFDTTDLEKLTGPLPYSLEDGVRLTLEWLTATSAAPAALPARAAKAVGARPR